MYCLLTTDNKISDITNKISWSQGSCHTEFPLYMYYNQLTLCVVYCVVCHTITVEPRYNEVLGTMKITLLYQVSHYIRVKKQRNMKSWDHQNDLVIRGFCYIRPLYNEVPLYNQLQFKCS